TCRSGFAGPAQSRTAKLPHRKQPNPLMSLMFAPCFLVPRLAVVTLQQQLRKFGLGAHHGCSSESVGIPRAIPSPCLLFPHHAVALSESGTGRGLRSVSLTRRVKSQYSKSRPEIEPRKLWSSIRVRLKHGSIGTRLSEAHTASAFTLSVPDGSDTHSTGP